jgi:hypothetical protein
MAILKRFSPILSSLGPKRGSKGDPAKTIFVLSPNQINLSTFAKNRMSVPLAVKK